MAEENVQQQDAEITEEALPQTFDREERHDDETGGKEPETPDRSLNLVIPSMVAQFAFGSPPTSSLPPGVAASPESEEAQQYVNYTAPILDMIDFHLCLGPIGHISPTARLVIGGVVLIGGVVAMKLPAIRQKKKEKEEKEEHHEKDRSDNPGTG